MIKYFHLEEYFLYIFTEVVLLQLETESLYSDIKLREKYRNYDFAKRIIDIILALIGIVLLSPIYILTAVAIKFDSKGPIFFNQKRVGLNGEEFVMHKFRTMVSDAEDKIQGLLHKNEMDGPMFKIKDDPRITKVGKFLRKTSIDELPQLFNVLKGDMSLVGPRPNLPREVAQFSSYHRKKLLIKPGITCYWQVMGRNSIGFNEWMELDIRYVNERSILVDIKLIFKTVKLLLGDRNAA